MRLSTIVAVLFFPVFTQIALAQDEAANQSTLEAQHQRAIDLSHNDENRAALAILGPLLVKHPDNYAVRRDFVVISAWDGDCDNSLRAYEPIRQHPDQYPEKEAYLVTAVAECMAAMRRGDEALALLKEGAKRHPGDQDIQQSRKTLLDDIALQRKSELQISAGSLKSDADNRENFFSVRYSQQLANATRGFVRYFTTRAQDPVFETGDLNRLGVGIMHWLNPKWYVEQEFSKEIKHGGDFGSTTTLIHYPRSLWELRAQYASFAEDIPLRAKAIGVDSDRLTLAADYHSRDYIWEWSGAFSTYDFSDDNKRDSVYTALGYGYLMKDKLEQRIIGSLFTSNNSLDNTVYFNPEHDISLTITHRTSLVLDSQFDRHVDHLSVSAGRYNQKGYSAKLTYGIAYEQDYDFSPLHSLHWGAEYASNVYDGNREAELSFIITYSRKLP